MYFTYKLKYARTNISGEQAAGAKGRQENKWVAVRSFKIYTLHLLEAI